MVLDRVERSETLLSPRGATALAPRATTELATWDETELLSPEARAVLRAAWDEHLVHGSGAALDTADLLIGLLRTPRTRRILEELGITVEGVRAAKRHSHGYELASRLHTLHPDLRLKSRQMGSIARRLGACADASGVRVIEPEDILAAMLIDGLGWGVSILDELGVDQLGLQQALLLGWPSATDEPSR